jgi:hypothetical protein
MIITEHPLHRSGRALLTHPALALGADAKPQLRIRVMQRRPWQPKIHQAAIRSQVSRVFWLRRRKVRYQARPTWNRNADSDPRFAGTP